MTDPAANLPLMLSVALASSSPGAVDRAPAVAVPAPASAPAPPELRGIGLIVGAGVTGGLGLAANLARIGLVHRSCAAGDTADVAETIRDCIGNSADYVVFSALAPVLDLTAAGLATGAGVLNGRYRAWQTSYGARDRARAGVYIGVGASLLGLGALSYMIARIGLWHDLYGVRHCATELAPGGCIRSRWSGWLSGITLGQAGVIVGAGMLAFGVTYRLRHVRRPGAALWRVRPAFTMTFAGLLVQARF